MRNIFVILFLFTCTVVSGQSLPGHFNLVPNGGLELLDGYNNIPYDSVFNTNNGCWIAATMRNVLPFTASWYKSQVELGHPRTGANALWMFSEMPWYRDTSKENNGKVYYLTSYPEVKLLEPLIAGTTYFFTMYVGVLKPQNRAKWDTTNLRTNIYSVANLGVYFSDTFLTRSMRYGRIMLDPQIKFYSWDIPFDDSFVYVKLSGTYKATGGEEFLTIGNFSHYKDFKFLGNTPADKTDSTVLHLYFPFIDDISLVRDTTQPMISLDHFSLGPDTSLCLGDSIRLGGGPYFFGYRWNTGDTSRFLTITKPGVYWCSADFGCSRVTDTIVVFGSVAPQAFNLQDTAICEALLPLSFNAPYRGAVYLWSNGSRDFSTRFFSTGKQWLRISNACGDQYATDTFEIQSLNTALDKLDLGKDTSNCMFGYFTDTITLRVPELKGHQINWSNGAHGNVIRIYDTGTYWVEVSNPCYAVSDTIRINGCAARDVLKVDIPNAFSPNGDGKNDVFRIRYLPQQVASFTLKIYNRYGQQVAELHNRSDYWDGGNFDIGVYFYLFTYEDVNGKKYSQIGDISLIR